jgi:hypothetical protein
MQETNMKQTAGSAVFHRITRHSIPNDRIVCSHHCENFKPKLSNVSQTSCSCLAIASPSVTSLEFTCFLHYSFLTLLFSHLKQDSGYNKIIELCLY